MNRLFRARVLENRRISAMHFLITLRPLQKTARPKSGQFFMVSVGDALDPLLRRPFSLHRQLKTDFQILYRTVGKATRILAERRRGDALEVLGPLGKGFPSPGRKETPLIVGGGIGTAPLLALAESLNHRNPVFFLGAKTRGELFCVKELRSIGIRPVIATDDGTLGRKGTVVDALKDFLIDRASRSRSCSLYACGPKPMLKEISFLADQFKLRAYISLEENMACGIGACLGCAVRTLEGMSRVCREGPVFRADSIVW